VRPDFIVFLQAVTAMGAWVVGLLFLRFWRDTRDRLFALFGAAFWILSVSYTLLALFSPTEEARPYLYLLRLVAFMLIIAAIADKNRSE
jgi:hypothetical protein